MNGLVFLFPLLLLVIPILVVIFIVILAGGLRPKRQYGVASVTQKGENVRSIGERRIADYFAGNNIRYVYEQEARGGGRYFSHKISNPDFYLPDYGVYVEYWGLVKADDRWARENYVRNMKRKMAIYHRNNIKFISIYPDNLENLDWIFRAKFRKVTGYDLPS